MNRETIIKTLNQGHILRSENQNQAYDGKIIQVGDTLIRHRRGKATPKKPGFFVVFWEKDEQGTNVPYGDTDSCDYLLVTTCNEKHQGFFLFPKACLVAQGILRSDLSPGKMAMRVYPSWEKELNKTAKQTQKWQAPYFIES